MPHPRLITCYMSSNQSGGQRDAERSRRAILDAAEQLFARDGYRGASLRGIGEQAGVSRGTPGYFFGSKEDLYRAVLERVFVEVGSAITDEHDRLKAAGGSPEQVLSGAIGVYMDFLVRRPAFVRLVEWESLNGGAVLADLAVHLETITRSVQMVAEELNRGAAVEMDPVQLMLSIMALCWFPLSQADTLMKTLGSDPFDPAFVEARKRHVVALIVDQVGRN